MEMASRDGGTDRALRLHQIVTIGTPQLRKNRKVGLGFGGLGLAVGAVCLRHWTPKPLRMTHWDVHHFISVLNDTIS